MQIITAFTKQAKEHDLGTFGPFASVLGKLPVKLLKARLMYSRLVRLFQDSGNGPDRVLFSRLRYFRVYSVKSNSVGAVAYRPTGKIKAS